MLAGALIDDSTVATLSEAPLSLAAQKIHVPAYQRSEEEAAKLQRVIATLFGLSSGCFGFKLLPHPENWACGFSAETQARIDQELESGSLDLEKMGDEQFAPDAFYYALEELRTLPEQQIYGVTHHESAHAQYTSFRLLIQGHKLAEREGKLATTWGLLANGVEDGRINRMKSAESEVTRDQIALLYERWEKEVSKNISTQSLIRQFTLNAVHCWLKGGPIPNGLDKRVQAAFEETKEAVFAYINEDDREKSFAILRDKIWPKVKHLEDEARNDQALREQKKGDESLWEKMKKRLFGEGDQSKDGQPLSEGEREKLQREFDQLPEAQKEQLKKDAEKNLDRKQAKEANKDGVKGFTYELDKKTGKHRLKHTPAPGDAEKKLGEEIIEDALEKERAHEAAEIERAKRALEMRRNGFEEHEGDLFDQYSDVRQSIIGMKRSFMRNLHGILPRELIKDFGGEFHSGPRIDLDKLVKRAPVGDARFYQRRTQEMQGDPLLNVELVIDNSGSMAGEKMNEARRATVLTLEVLSDLGLPSAVKKFDANFKWIQERHQAYKDPRARVKPEILTGLTANGASTNIGSPLIEATDAVTAFSLRHPKTLTLIVVISDGDANTGITGQALKSKIETLKRNAVVVNINLSGSSAEIEKSKFYFGNNSVVACDSASQLPDALVRVLKAAFERALRKRK